MRRQPNSSGHLPPTERILDAAASVFAESGYDGARVDEIARRAGINKAMLYYHVGDKEALYRAVLLRNFARISDRLAAALARGGTPRERLERVIATISATVQELPDHPRIVLREVASGAVHLGDDVLARMLEALDVVGRVLADGVAGGELRRTDPMLTHLAIVGSVVFLNSIAPLRARAAGLVPGGALPPTDTDVGGFVADLVLNGLAVGPSQGASR